MLTWSLELLSFSFRHIQDDICNNSILSAITQIYLKNTPWENTFSICITTVVIMKPSVPKIQNLAKGRQTYQYPSSPVSSNSQHPSFSKKFHRSSWKDNQQVHNGTLEEGHAAANSSTFVFPQVIYQSQLAIQQTRKRTVWINLKNGSKAYSISLAPTYSLCSAYWPK